ncbi:antitoxin (DNA-binding transcriptional repressor) of toxin-antitoxin stability system [Haloactinospora alba]|uniref:Antitoxin n=1 Tax=Haloactinospora alba TaxID=405555 RepID=A0A543N9G4_9ACTN|nr:type II toxin-antitoxin system Phd/YefM family antitoxin [Haloactinospora alba]TQN28474.1 antitoxin (DNA-binding transcriptional repressor) of toxin-antitoxin stability system [Haloactinospora alba]
MSTVSVREFSYNPSSLFSRVEEGETIQVTRHGKVIAVLVPGAGTLGRYSDLVAKGLIKLTSTTTGDLGQLTTFATSGDESPLDVLLAERAEDER